MNNKNYYRKETLQGRCQSKLYRFRSNNNQMKRSLYQTYVKAGNNVLELGGGRGGDLLKLNACRCRFVLLCDIDRNGLEEARRRFRGIRNRSFSLQTLCGDFSQDQSEKIMEYRKQFDVVSIQFAVHYFISTPYELLVNVDCCLKRGGYVLVTYLDGEVAKATGSFQVFDNERNTIVSLDERDEKHLSMYFDSFQSPSVEPYVYRENIVDIFRKGGYTVHDSGRFKPLTEMERWETKLTEMYSYLIFKKPD